MNNISILTPLTAKKYTDVLKELTKQKKVQKPKVSPQQTQVKEVIKVEKEYVPFMRITKTELVNMLIKYKIPVAKETVDAILQYDVFVVELVNN